MLRTCSQSPFFSTFASFVWRMLFDLAIDLSRRVFFSVFSSFFASTANRCSTPGNVGRKKGACSGFLGGSVGWFRCYVFRPINLGGSLNILSHVLG